MVILGHAGAGKTGAAIRLLLDAVAHRETRTDAERRWVPVPVMLTSPRLGPDGAAPGGVDVRSVVGDYPFLKAREFGLDAATRLVRNGLVSVILDGLDEMPANLRAVALRALDEHATFRVVLLTRGLRGDGRKGEPRTARLQVGWQRSASLVVAGRAALAVAYRAHGGP